MLDVAAIGFGGIRQTSLLAEIICLQAVIFAGLMAALAFVRGFPAKYGEPLKPGWIAAGAVMLMLGLLFLKPLISGRVWLPWI